MKWYMKSFCICVYSYLADVIAFGWIITGNFFSLFHVPLRFSLIARSKLLTRFLISKFFTLFFHIPSLSPYILSFCPIISVIIESLVENSPIPPVTSSMLAPPAAPTRYILQKRYSFNKKKTNTSVSIKIKILIVNKLKYESENGQKRLSFFAFLEIEIERKRKSSV